MYIPYFHSFPRYCACKFTDGRKLAGTTITGGALVCATGGMRWAFPVETDTYLPMFRRRELPDNSMNAITSRERARSCAFSLNGCCKSLSIDLLWKNCKHEQCYCGVLHGCAEFAQSHAVLRSACGPYPA